MEKSGNIKFNFVVASFSQLLTILFAFIVPQMLINYYGPQIHGLTSVITSLLMYLTLIESGLGSASVQGLYKPLSNNDKDEINAGINAIAKFYTRVGFIFSIMIILLSIFYPIFSSNGLEYYMVFLLILISGLAQTIEYFFCSKYKILLQADKKLYIVNLVNSIGILIQGVLRIIFILFKFNIYFVQLVPAIIYIIRLLLISFYVKKNYKYLDKSVEPNYQISSKRWNVMIHQTSNLVVNNTDNIVLSNTIGYTAVSVYSVYHMVISNLSGFLTQALSNAITANFGHLLSSNDMQICKATYEEYEKLFYYLISIIFSICAVALYPFVQLYIGEVDGVQYADVWLVILFITNAVLANVRIPQLTIVTAAGHFKETQWHAMVEAIINIVVSITLVFRCGIYGVLIGTTCSFLFRDVMFVWYANRNILNRPVINTIKNMLQMILILTVAVSIGVLIVGLIDISGWMQWLIVCVITGIIAMMGTLVYICFFDKNTLIMMRKIFLSRLNSR